MKKIIIVLLSLLTLVLVSCKSGNEDNKESEKVYQEKLSDVNFENGFEVSALLSQSVSYTWWQYQGTASNTPLWSLSQYCDLSKTRDGYDSTVNDLSLGTIFEDGFGIEESDGNVEILRNVSGSKEARYNKDTHVLSLNVDTSKEYINQETKEIVPRSDGEDWVHLILGQSAGGVMIADYSEIIVEIDFELTSNDIISEVGGASQFQWIFSIKDKESVVGDYFWFNLTFFDSRYEEFEGTSLYDGGKADSTGKFIYAPKTGLYLDEPIEVGKKVSVKVNIKPYLEEAFKIAQEKGALAQSNFSDMMLSTFNLGWEVTNVSKVGVDISHVSLKVGE